MSDYKGSALGVSLYWYPLMLGDRASSCTNYESWDITHTVSHLGTAMTSFSKMQVNHRNYTTWGGYNIAFMLHTAVEFPAALKFMFYPSKQLGVHTPQAHAIVRQYALLLMSTVLVSLLFARRPVDELSRAVGGAFAIYHIGPFLRSWYRLRKPSVTFQQKLWSEAFLYLVVHLICGLALLSHFAGL